MSEMKVLLNHVEVNKKKVEDIKLRKKFIHNNQRKFEEKRKNTFAMSAKVY